MAHLGHGAVLALAPVFPDSVVTAGNGACTTTILAGDGAIGTDSVFIFHEVIAVGGDGHAVLVPGGLDGHLALDHVLEDLLRRALLRVEVIQVMEQAKAALEANGGLNQVVFVACGGSLAS